MRLRRLRPDRAEPEPENALPGSPGAVHATRRLRRQPFALTYLDDELQCSTPGADQQLAAARPELVQDFTLSSSSAGTPRGRLVVGLNPRLPRDDRYRAFLELVADQVGTALANARAYEAERMRAEALSALGYATHVAFDAPGALHAVEEFVPDVALLDIGLPVMSGYELAHRLRNRPPPHRSR